MDENKIGKCVNIEKHVAAAYLAEFAMARWLGIEALNFIIALENVERAPFHDRNDRHGSTADIRAVCAKAVMNLKGRLGVLKANRIINASAFTRYGQIATSHMHLLRYV